MKALLVLVGLAGFGAVAGAIYIGGRMAEPTVVPDPYEAGLRHDQDRHAHDRAAVGPRAPPACDPSTAACARRVGGATVTLEVAPRPVRPMADLVFTVSVTPPAAAGPGAGRLELDMPGMVMGPNRVVLREAGQGRWTGTGVLVRCPSGRRTWRATVGLPPATPGGAAVSSAFVFEVAER
jgi:hypothetical protein